LKARCEDSCLATRSALEGGVVIGAGLALHNLPSGLLDEGVIQASTKSPAYQIASNAGCDVGYDALSGAKVDGMTSGILDPAIVVKAALRNAASVGSVMLASDCVIQISE